MKNYLILYMLLFAFIITIGVFSGKQKRAESLSQSGNTSNIITQEELAGEETSPNFSPDPQMQKSIKEQKEGETLYPLRFMFLKQEPIFLITGNGNNICSETNPNVLFSTNDPSWEAVPLTFIKATPNKKTWKQYFCTEDQDITEESSMEHEGEDNMNVFLLGWNIATQKKEIPNYVPSFFLGIQSVDYLVGYSNGYIVTPTLKLPVDEKTFTNAYPDTRKFYKMNPHKGCMFQVKAININDEDWEKQRLKRRRITIRNNHKQYNKYIGHDKEWVYFWMANYGSYDEQGAYVIARVKKASDFKILKTDNEVQGVFSHDNTIDLQKEKFENLHERKELITPFAEDPGIYYHDNKVYIALFYGQIRSFPVDGESLTIEHKQIRNKKRGYEQSYELLSDKKRYYQLIYHIEGEDYELQRIAK